MGGTTMSERVTVKSVLKNINELVQAESITDKETGEEISVQDLQDLFFQHIDMLSDLLGIDLDEE